MRFRIVFQERKLKITTRVRLQSQNHANFSLVWKQAAQDELEAEKHSSTRICFLDCPEPSQGSSSAKTDSTYKKKLSVPSPPPGRKDSRVGDFRRHFVRGPSVFSLDVPQRRISL